METNFDLPIDMSTDDSGCPAVLAGAPLRLAVRPDKLTAQKVEVGMILQAMLGTQAAAEYLANNAVDPAIVARVLHQPQLRRGRHDASGIRCK